VRAGSKRNFDPDFTSDARMPCWSLAMLKCLQIGRVAPMPDAGRAGRLSTLRAHACRRIAHLAPTRMGAQTTTFVRRGAYPSCVWTL